MAKGVLGIIICPMLQDELIHSLSTDKEIGRIVLLENEYSGSIKERLESRGIKHECVPEADFDSGKVEFDRSIYNIVIKSNDLALHAEPAALKAYIEKQVVDIQPYVDVVGLYYGMCGNYGWDMTKWCQDNGYKPAFMFRGKDDLVCDDCVAVAIGGSEMYKKLVKRYTGMFFITPSIVDNWRVFVGAGDLAKSLQNMPKETLDEFGIHCEDDYMRWMFEIGNYEHSLVIDTGLGNSGDFMKKCEDLSAKLNLKPIIIEDGWVSLDCADGIYENCRKALS